MYVHILKIPSSKLLQIFKYSVLYNMTCCTTYVCTHVRIYECVYLLLPGGHILITITIYFAFYFMFYNHIYFLMSVFSQFNHLIHSQMGVNAEHSWADAPIVGHLLEYGANLEFQPGQYTEEGDAAGTIREDIPLPKRLRWEFTEEVRKCTCTYTCDYDYSRSISNTCLILDHMVLSTILYSYVHMYVLYLSIRMYHIHILV